MQNTTLADYQAEHFIWSASDGVGTVTLNRPERKNPLTFDSYAECATYSAHSFMQTTSMPLYFVVRVATSVPAAMFMKLLGH